MKLTPELVRTYVADTVIDMLDDLSPDTNREQLVERMMETQ